MPNQLHFTITMSEDIGFDVYIESDESLHDCVSSITTLMSSMQQPLDVEALQDLATELRRQVQTVQDSLFLKRNNPIAKDAS